MKASRRFISTLRTLAPMLLAVALVLVGCDSAGSNDRATQRVSLGFSTTSTGSSTKSATKTSQSAQLSIQGSNGTLTIDAIHMVVDEFELEGDSEIAEFEVGPLWFELPLDNAAVEPVASTDIPEGTYTELEFEVEDFDFDDLDEDDEDENERQQLLNLLAQIRNTYPEWPEGASMVVVGSFAPGTGASPIAFTTYLAAEIEIELDLIPPIEVSSSGPDRSIVVRLDPAIWFSRPDGTVWDLSAENFADTGSIVEFEAEFENGVARIEIDGD